MVKVCDLFSFEDLEKKAIDLVFYVYTNKQMLFEVYLDSRWSSTTSKSAESGNYEAFVTVLYCHFINEVIF